MTSWHSWPWWINWTLDIYSWKSKIPPNTTHPFRKQGLYLRDYWDHHGPFYKAFKFWGLISMRVGTLKSWIYLLFKGSKQHSPPNKTTKNGSRSDRLKDRLSGFLGVDYGWFCCLAQGFAPPCDVDVEQWLVLTHMAWSFQKDQHHFSFEKCLNEFAEHFQNLVPNRSKLLQIQNVQPNLYTRMFTSQIHVPTDTFTVFCRFCRTSFLLISAWSTHT